tara:strand:+ start:3310 stop:4095 length:786 start_codon:yes stop_codon:yes gene_type:complete
MKIILISSHRRSGTHLLIDSLRANIEDSIFPNHRELPADFNLGTLFSKDEKIFDTFKLLIKNNSTVIIKSHLLPDECNIKNPKDKFETFIKEIYNSSKKLYIYRDGKDTLVSLYRFLKPSIPFSEFLRQKNDHIVKEIRLEKKFDINRILYWSYHVNQWKLDKSVKNISFSDLNSDFESTLCNVLQFLHCPIIEPLHKPQIPKNKLLHGLRKKLNHYGIGSLPESSSVRPNKGNANLGIQYFNDDSDSEFYINNTNINAVQ